MKGLGLVATIALISSACGTAHMVVPPEVASSSEEIAVTGRSSFSGALANESFKLGSWEVKDVDRDWDSKSSAGALGFSSEKTAGGYAYKFAGAGGEMSGSCATEGGGKSMALGSGMSVGKNFAKLGCSCSRGDEPVKVVISSSTTEKYTGELSTRSGSYKVTAIYESEGTLSTGQPSGYRVDGDTPRGAVEVHKPGRAWFARDMEEGERADLACLYAGLLLYMPPRDL